MRTFKVETADGGSVLDLSTNSALATNPKGLGADSAINFINTDEGDFISNVKTKFSKITLDVLFNADGTSGYANYTKASAFFSLNGRRTLRLVYDDGIKERKCDVVFKSLTKSEVAQNGLFLETLTLEKISYWYVEKTYTIEDSDSAEPVEITNKFFERLPIKFKGNGEFTGFALHIVNKNTGKGVSMLRFLTDDSLTGELIIDAKNKIITLNGNSIYHLTDKHTNSFLYIPTGTYYILASHTGSTEMPDLEVTVQEYEL